MIERYDVMYAKENKGQTFWSKVGVAWLNKSGSGYNLVLDSIPAPVDGAYRMNLFEPKQNSERSNSGGSAYSGGNNGGTSGGSSGGFNRPGANRGQQQADIPEDDIPF
jgi:hypothetical protein